MGTSFKDAAGNVKPMSEILPGLADTFKSMPDGAEKAALATQLFGRSGTQMLPFLNKGSAGIAELTAKAQQMGLIVDDVSAKSFADARVSTRMYNSTIQGLMVTLGGVLVPVINNVKNVFRNAFIPVILAATHFIQDHRTQILGLATTIGDFAGRVGAIVTGLFSLLGRGDYTDEFGKSLGITEDSPVVGILLKIRDVVGGVFQTIGGLFASLGPTIGPLIGQFFALWSQISPLSLLFQALAPLLPQIAATVSQLGGSLSSALMPVLAALMPILGGVISVLMNSLMGIFQAILPLLPPIVAIIGNLAGILVGALGSALTLLLPMLGEIATVLLEALGGAITMLLPVIGNLIGVLGPMLGQVFEMLTPLLTMIVESFGLVLNAVMPLVDPIMSVVKAFMPLIGSALPLLAALLPPIIQLLTAVLTPILALISPLLDLLVPVLVWLVDILAVLIDWIVQAITWFIGLVTGSEDAGKGMQAAWGKVLKFFGDLWGGIGKFFADGFKSIVGFFNDLPKTVIGLLAGAGSWLVDIGKNLIQGLLDGAGSILKNIGSFFLKILPAWIVDPFKAALGIRSPSRVFAALGLNITDGLVQGLTDGQGGVNAASRDLLNIPSAQLRAGADVGVAGSSNTRLPIVEVISRGGEALLELIDVQIRNADGTTEQIHRGGLVL
jgi:phage-related protein